jgi:hypothetical protein
VWVVGTAADLAPFAHDMGCMLRPFRWDDGRRAVLRSEVDAMIFHIYGIERDDVDYIMGTFPIVRRRDEETHGEYRTKRMILEIYDEIAAAGERGDEYQTRLDPPPADALMAHADQVEANTSAV